MNDVEAEKIVKDARAAFDKKTSNKVYAKDPASMIAYTDLPNRLQAQKDLEDFAFTAQQKSELGKAIKRNETQINSAHLRANNPCGGTAYARGKAMAARLPVNTLGNCQEHSEVAAYLAIERFSADAKGKTYLVTVQSPGDHVFCVVGLNGVPPWKNVGDMAVDITSAFAWIIDPWMNFACYVPNYKTKANDKMTKWLGLGKRIYWEGKKGNSPGWYQPGGDYTDALASSTLKFEKAD